MSENAAKEYCLWAIVTDEGDMIDVYMHEEMARDELADGWLFPKESPPDQCRIIPLLARVGA